MRGPVGGRGLRRHQPVVVAGRAPNPASPAAWSSVLLADRRSRRARELRWPARTSDYPDHDIDVLRLVRAVSKRRACPPDERTALDRHRGEGAVTPGPDAPDQDDRLSDSRL